MLMGMTDSSPQGGINWQLTSFTYVSSSAFLPVVVASRLLRKRFWLSGLSSQDSQADLQPEVDDEAACATLWTELQWLALTPAGLGSRRQSVQHKLHAILHQLFLVSGSPAQLAALCKRISVWTLDLGVEASITKVPPSSFSSVFPYFLPLVAPQDSEEAWEAAHNESIHFSGAVVIGGFMHIVSNMVKGFLDVLPTWQTQIGPLATNLTSFLKHSWSRERFIATCLIGEFEQFRPLYKVFKGDLTRWRWGDVATVIHKLLLLEPSLRMAWRPERLLFQHNATAAVADSKEGKMATEAIGSDFFWAYLKMIEVVTTIADNLYQWAQSCPCHTKRGRQRLGKTCPNAGRWLPELATGYLEDFARTLMSTGYAQILSQVRNVSDAEASAILQDYEHARCHMLAHLRMKGAQHRDLPLVLAGLAHADQMKAHEAARRALSLWEQMPLTRRATAHSHTRAVFEDAEAQVELHAFLADMEATLDDFPVLLQCIYRFALARIDEHDMVCFLNHD